jgi:hypothetical protein
VRRFAQFSGTSESLWDKGKRPESDWGSSAAGSNTVSSTLSALLEVTSFATAADDVLAVTALRGAAPRVRIFFTEIEALRAVLG